jgi:ubiquinone/menaquinone biosynthesis C-methylase UbiE
MRSRTNYARHSLSFAGSESSSAAALRRLPAHDPAGRSRRPAWRPAKRWDNRVGELEELAATPGFLRLREEIIELARLSPTDRVLDIGAGTGLLAVAVAPLVQHVTALDVSPAMCHHLEAKLAASRITNVEVVIGTTTELPLEAGSVDVVLSNYCLHHLRDADKRVALNEVRRVLRPGGRLVIGDMMFQVGLRDARDRALIARFVGRMLRRGPAGLWRLLKNVIRQTTGRREHPASVDWWQRALEDAKFAQVAARPLAHEGGVATGRRPADGVRLLDRTPIRDAAALPR